MTRTAGRGDSLVVGGLRGHTTWKNVGTGVLSVGSLASSPSLVVKGPLTSRTSHTLQIEPGTLIHYKSVTETERISLLSRRRGIPS